MKKEKKPITYQVDWIKDGWCYRTTCGVPKDALKKYRAIAKVLNEKLEQDSKGNTCKQGGFVGFSSC